MAKLVEITIGKEFKKGLPNFSNITARCDMTWEIGEKEEPDFPAMWDTINRELQLQADSTDASWIVTKEYKKHIATTINTPKGSDDNE